MNFPYKPPRHLERLSQVVNAARTQVGWGVHDDGSVGVEHIMSNNPFAGKAKTWGIASIDDNGDIQMVSNGPGNNTADEALPEELVQQIVQFYEKEGLNVRNVHESDPTKQGKLAEKGTCPKCGNTNLDIDTMDRVLGGPSKVSCEYCGWRGDYSTALEYDKTADIDQGMAACPHCGENKDLHVIAALDKFNCNNCGTIGPLDDLIRLGDDPDPDRNMFEHDPDYDGQKEVDDWVDYESKVKEAANGFTFQGAPASGSTIVSGIVARTDRGMSREQIEQLVGGLDPDTHGVQKEYVDKMNEGTGTSFPTSDNPFVNRGGSIDYSNGIEDHFFETNFEKKAAPGDVGIPGGSGDTRNFDPQSQPGFIVVSAYLTPDDNWLFLSPRCKGIIAEQGGITSHGAVEARKMGIAAIVQAEGASAINPGDVVKMDPTTGRVDVNGGDSSYQEGEVIQARQELVRFVWSQGQGVFSLVTKPLTAEMAEEEYQPGLPDRSHGSMYEYMDDEDMLDYGDVTIGVVYDGGEADYYQPITDEPALTNWLKSNFPDQVERVVYKNTTQGLTQPELEHTSVANDTDERGTKAPVCPSCGSHSYSVSVFPNETRGEAVLKCLNDGTEYKHELIMNPKSSADEGIECGHCGHRPAEHDKNGCNVSGCKCAQFIRTKKVDASIEKLAPGKEHMKGVSPKRNRQYEHILESCHKEHPDWTEDRCKELAARTVNKQREEKGETKDSSTEDCGCDERTSGLSDLVNRPHPVRDLLDGGRRAEINCPNCGKPLQHAQGDPNGWLFCPNCAISGDVLGDIFKQKGLPIPPGVSQTAHVAASGKYSPGTRVELNHKNLHGKGTILELGGKHEHLDEEHYVIQLDGGEKVEEIPESAFKKIKSASKLSLSYPEDPNAQDELVAIMRQIVEAHQIGDEQEVLRLKAELAARLGKTADYAINDTDGKPLEIGQLYLMHSTQYKIPDVVRITNINERQIEAHIDSDVRGMFPIEIDPAEFANLGYSFEPYATAKTANEIFDGYAEVEPVNHHPNTSVLFAAVKSALAAQVQGINSELNSDPQVGEAVAKALRHFGDPETALAALNDEDSFSNFMRYYSHKIAARALHISPKRQKELINENMGGLARNFEKLNLDGTHYNAGPYGLIPSPTDDDLDQYFLW